MFEVNTNSIIYKYVQFESDGTTIDVCSIDKEDKQKQAQFMIDVIESLYQLCNSDADEIWLKWVSEKYDWYPKKEESND